MKVTSNPKSPGTTGCLTIDETTHVASLTGSLPDGFNGGPMSGVFLIINHTLVVLLNIPAYGIDETLELIGPGSEGDIGNGVYLGELYGGSTNYYGTATFGKKGGC